MSKSYIDKACAVVPEFENRIYRFDKKLRIAQYAEHSIYDYKLKIAQAALYLQKLPDDFTQDDVEGYLSSLLDQKRYSISFFKHTVFGLQNYYKVMGLKQPRGLVLPKVRKPKKLPRVLSQRSIARLLKSCGLYDKALLALIYDCALRVSEVCRLRSEDVCCTNFHYVKKLKPCGSKLPPNYYLCPFIHLGKVKGDDGTLLTFPS